MVNIVDEAIDRARSFKNKVFGKAQSLANGNLDLINLAKLPRRTVQRVVDNGDRRQPHCEDREID